MTSFQEMLMLMLIVGLLTMTGLWPQIIRALRELRGDIAPDEPSSCPDSKDMDLCYKLLGISPSAPWEEVEKAYRRKAKVHHPDHGGDDDTMRALNDAYTLIKRARKQRGVR